MDGIEVLGYLQMEPTLLKQVPKPVCDVFIGEMARCQYSPQATREAFVWFCRGWNGSVNHHAIR